MTSPRLHRDTRWWRIVALIVCLWPAGAGAQDVHVPTLKASFLVNFVKFAEWRDGSVADGRPFTFCVSGDKAVFEALELAVRQNYGPDVQRVWYMPVGPFDACQLLYFGGVPERDWHRALESLTHASVFTVSDAREFAERGGMVGLRMDNGKMRFSINPAAAQRARIALSAKLLGLATLVKERP